MGDKYRHEIAIVGIASRMPGASGPDEFWDLLRGGVDATRDRDRDRLFGPDHGGFVDGLDGFDARFFQMGPREAAAADPQQRLALELAWHGLEDAGIVVPATSPARIGVFLGVMAADYADLVAIAGTRGITRHTLTGVGRAMVANRISHTLRLFGPSMTVDTGQSSSLVAVHLACESLRSAEAEIALAGGIHLNVSPLSSAVAEAAGALSPDGTCYVFDERANGYVRGEGGGVVVLKLLARAIEDGDRIYAVIKGSAFGTGTGDSGLTVPSVTAQARTIGEALDRAGVRPADVQYVELHGTGTRVGDPVEAEALGAAYGRLRPDTAPLVVGSVKTNIGHLEGAAGIAGLIKTALCIDRRELVPSRNFSRPNPRIALDELGLRVAASHEPWPAAEQPIAAGISSFGIGGTCCHMVLTAAPAPARPGPGPDGRDGRSRVLPVLVSGHGEVALRAQAGRLREHLLARPELTLADVAFSAATTRAHLAYRAAVTASGRDGLLAGLGTLATDEPGASVVTGEVVPGRTAFVFSGQGAQRPGMGTELAASYPVFAQALEEICAHLDPLLGRPLRDLLAAPEGSEQAALLDQTQFTQAGLFAVEVALYRLVESLGIRPDFLIGHSVGELAAAHVAGVLSLADACTMVAARGRLMGALPAGGGMAAVQATEEEVTASLATCAGRLSVAAVNGPQAVVVSGDQEALEEWLPRWADRKTSRLRVSHAFHSPLMDPMLAEFADVALGLHHGEPVIPVVSNLTGTVVSAGELADPGYWVRHIRQAVRFADGIATLHGHGVTRFFEIGPDGMLTAMARRILDGEPGTVFAPALRARQPEPEAFARFLAQAHIAGTPVDWPAFYAGHGARRVPLPSYAFQRQRYWLSPVTESGETIASAGGPASHRIEQVQLEQAGSLARRLATMPEPDREGAVLELVQAHVAAVLGHSSPDAVAPGRAFKELGFDSLAGTEFGDRLAQVAGMRLPATLTFDHPTPAAVARFLLAATSRHTSTGRTVAATPPAATPDSAEPLAIVGMSCRFAGGVASPDQLWDLVAAGRDAVSGLPQDRGWDLERLYDPDPGRPGTVYTQGGGFVSGAGDFDAGFFGIAPREALAMDPQQRLVLEAAWEALEDAGIDPDSLRGSDAGVFCGAGPSGYGGSMRPELEGFRLTGTTASVISGRVAYVLGLTGPAVSVDTACSSSLVALHLAAQSLRSGECSLALAGGVTVLADPFLLVEFSRQRGLAPDGRCKAYAAGANGTGFSDGLGLVVLERLSDARRNGHRVLGLVRGSAVNHDGASNGLTAPSGPSQERVIGTALANARLSPAEIDVVEGHGTGTRLGDPIEAGALIAAYGPGRAEPLRLGSVKSNIGHASSAAGVAGVIKMVLAMRHGVVPKTLHVDAPSPNVDWDAGAVKLVTEAEPWPDAGRARRAGVSSFGISGTNAHLILEQAPPELEARADGQTRSLPAVPVLVSAKEPVALRAQARRLREHLLVRPELALAEVGFSAATTRAHLEYRAAVTAPDREGLLDGLAGLAAGEPGAGVVTGRAVQGRTAFLFSGQGAQRPGMGMELAAAYPVFARAVEEICGHLDPLLGRPLRDLLSAPEGSEQAALLDQTQYTQAGLFAVEVALFRLAESLGIRPDFLIGHSVGELAAAHVAGVLSLADACTLVAARGRLMGALPAGGGMAAVQATEEEVIASLESYAGRLAVAAVNGPQAVVVSGDEAALTEWLPRWADRKTSRLRVSHAFHSPLMDPMLDEFAEVARGLRYGEPRIPVVSNLTGTVASTELADPGYWVSHVRQPVRFAAGIAALAGLGVTRFYELGPDAVLTAMARGVLGDDTGTVLAPALRARHPEPETFAGFLGQVHAAGTAVDWAAFYAGTEARPVPLPTYAFQRQRYWLSPSAGATDPAAAGQGRLEHPLLVAAVQVGDRDEWLFTGRLSLEAQPWLADHAVLGAVIMPGAALTELALTAGRHVGSPVVEELVLESPLLLPEGTAVQLQVTVAEAGPDGRRAVAVYTRPQPGPDEDGPPETTCHARGTLALGTAPLASPFPAAWPPPGARAVPVEALYARLADIGYDYGPVFQGVRAAWQDGEHVYAEVALADDHAATAQRFGIHPALLDAALHGGVDRLDRDDESSAQLPFSWAGVRLGQAGPSRLRVLVTPAGAGTLRIDLAGPHGEFVASVDQLVFRPVQQAQLDQAGRPSNGSLFRVDWNPVPAASHGGTGRPRVASLGEPAGAAERFADLDALERALAAGAPVPDLVLAPVPAVPSPDGVAAAAQAVAEHTLALLQGWLASARLADARLVVVTRRAIAAGDSDPQPPDLTQAPVWGLVRCAQSEHPGRFGLIDLDGQGDDPDWAALTGLDEPQLAVRQGRLLAPRLARTPAAAGDQLPPPQSDGTVLITGGTGGLGAILARHLAGTGWAKRLLLVSRRGLDAAGAPELVEDLTALGCAAQVAACDVADAEQLRRLLKSLEHPLTAVIHAAGLLDDGVIESLTPQQLDRVMRPKVHGALNLHELTADTELVAFVLFSSVSALVGSPGQANYAAANAVLDALAQKRRAEGLSGSSLAWGLWADAGGMAGQLDETDLARFRRMGVEALSTDLGLELFDQAQRLDQARLDQALLVPVRLDLASLRARARAGTLPALLRGLVPAPARRTEADVPLAQRLADVQEAEREQLVLLLVQTQVAAVIGHTSPGMIDPGRAFKDLGFDSLTAVEFRNRLMQASGVRLPPTLVFDHPTSAAVAQLLLSEAGGSAEEPSIERELARLEGMLATMATGEKQRVAGRLRTLLAAITDGGRQTSERIEAATSVDEVFQLIDAEFSEA